MNELKQLKPQNESGAMSKSSKMSVVKVNPDSGKSVDEILKERGSNYGSFATHAEYAEDFNHIFQRSPNWKTMKPDNKESLRIIANKIGRILNGNPEYDDNWRDIAGYATLVCKRIEDDNRTD